MRKAYVVLLDYDNREYYGEWKHFFDKFLAVFPTRDDAMGFVEERAKGFGAGECFEWVASDDGLDFYFRKKESVEAAEEEALKHCKDGGFEWLNEYYAGFYSYKVIECIF